jgi:hypothetical protein
MVPVIKILVIMLARLVSTPIRILSLKILPVLRMSLVPGIPSRLIPVSGSYNIDWRIGVIWGKSNLGAEKEIQDAIQEPITFVKDPWGIGPNPWSQYRARCRRIDLCLGKGRHCPDRATSQQNCYHQYKT